jgi:hypothetical protein
MLPALRKNLASFVIPERHFDLQIETNNFILNHYAMLLAAKLCAADGKINSLEINNFFAEFPFFSENKVNLFLSSADDKASIYIYCKRFSKFSNSNQKLAMSLFTKLFKLAICDGPLNPSEIAYLEKLSDFLKLPTKLIEGTIEIYFSSGNVKKSLFASEDDIKKIFRANMNKFHPDKFISAKNISDKLKNKILKLANEKIISLNENYRKAIK